MALCDGVHVDLMCQRNSKAAGLLTSKNIFIYLKLTYMCSFMGKSAKQKQEVCSTGLIVVFDGEEIKKRRSPSY